MKFGVTREGQTYVETDAGHAVTVQSVARPRGELDDEDRVELGECMEDWRRAEALQADVRTFCVAAVERSSFRAVSEATGFSTNTLQRWKREAK